MVKCFVNLIVIVIVCSAELIEAATVKIDSECIANPTANPARCMNHINEVVRKLYSLRPSMNAGLFNGMQTQLGGKRLQPGQGLTRKFNYQANDETPADEGLHRVYKKRQHDAVTEESSDNISDDAEFLKSLKRLVNTNKIEGNEVDHQQTFQRDFKTNRRDVNDALGQLTDALQRIAIVNNLKGNTVNTEQKVNEYNDNDNSGKELSDEVRQALQRLAVENNIKGNKVNTKQDIKEFNREVVEALTKAVRRMGFASVYSHDQLLKAITANLRRIAIKNNITGGTVNTKQEVNEYNNKVVKELTDTVRRLAVQNNFSGKATNIGQKVEENNNSPLSELAERLVLEGNVYKNAKSDDSYDEGSFDEPEILKAFEKFTEMFSPIEKSVAKDVKKMNSSDEAIPSTDDEPTRSYFYRRLQPLEPIARRFTINNNFADEAAQDAPNADDTPIQAYQEQKESDSDDADVDDDAEGDDEAEADDDFDDDDFYDYDDYQYEQADETSARRMTVNNDYSQRRMMEDKVITGAGASLVQSKSGMSISQPLVVSAATIKPMVANLVVPGKAEVKSMSKQTSANPPKVANSKEKSRLICKTRKGKKITENNLRKVLSLLENMKVSDDY